MTSNPESDDVKRYADRIDRGVELLQLCQTLQSQSDGVQRPAIGPVDRTTVPNQFAADVEMSVEMMRSLHNLIPMMLKLRALGQALRAQGRIEGKAGNSLSSLALEYVVRQHASTQGADENGEDREANDGDR